MCATGQCPHERHSCHVEKHCVKISHDLRGIFHSEMFWAPGQGIAIWKGSRSIWAPRFFEADLCVSWQEKCSKNIFLETHYWRFAWKFNVGWNFVLGQNSMPSRLGVLLGTPGTSKTSISDVRCTKLSKSSKLTTLEKSRGEIWKWATKYFCWFS